MEHKMMKIFIAGAMLSLAAPVIAADGLEFTPNPAPAGSIEMTVISKSVTVTHCGYVFTDESAKWSKLGGLKGQPCSRQDEVSKSNPS